MSIQKGYLPTAATNKALREKAKSAALSFWQKSLLGVLITLFFCSGVGSSMWVVHSRAVQVGYRKPFEEACVNSCGARNAEVGRVEPMSAASLRGREFPVYQCVCTDGAVLTPVLSRVYTDWSTSALP